MMKIATYNVRNLYDPGTFIDEKEENPVEETFFNQRVEHFTRIFRELDLDIICLQEVGGEKGINGRRNHQQGIGGQKKSVGEDGLRVLLAGTGRLFGGPSR
jgi:endonuclease/exonuclease/phosphatase family metal-dependent hydrolase